MAGNGMKTFSVHAGEGPSALQGIGAAAGALADAVGVEEESDGDTGFFEAVLDRPRLALDALTYAPTATGDAETAARVYLDRALMSDDVPLVAAEPVGAAEPEFRSLGVEQIPLTGTQTVKFRQQYDGVPVYGSLVTVEMDGSNELISLNTSIGDPSSVDPNPSISREDAIRIATGMAPEELAGEEALDTALYFYFDSATETWHLAYIVKDCPTHRRQDAPSVLADVVVDAHDGTIIEDLPRFQSVQQEDAFDALGINRPITFIASDGGKVLRDDDLGVETYDFGFKDARFQWQLLPGDAVNNPPTPWDPAAVSAHANAMMVASFVRNVLVRNGLDGKGSKYRSSIQCAYGGSGHEWRNAAWVGTQMIFGQRSVSGTLRTYAVAADVVAHEMVHGLTSATARLEYKGMPGALNESYSDILGVIISNAGNPDRQTWNWEIGEDLDATGLPLRDLSNPAAHGQPAHLDQYVALSLDEAGDWGGVHTNSGIHNFAGYKMLIATNSKGSYVFSADEVAALFYLALSQHLTRTSTFGRSRRGLKLAAMTLFRNDPALSDKLAAIDASFDEVGIAEEI